MTTTSSEPRPALDPDRLAELEEERRFLLRSLADLEREREAGDVEDADYVALRDGYTARAAAVLRAIEAGRTALPPKQPANWRRRAAIVLGVILFGAVAGVTLAFAVGDRSSGDTITGSGSANEVAQLLTEGRQLLFAEQYGPASEKYLAVLDIDRDNVEALTYAGWVLAVSSQFQSAETAAQLLERSKQFLDNAITIDPAYADAHCFRAIVAWQFEQDAPAAASSRDECLAANPSAEIRSLVDDYGDPSVTTTTAVTEDSAVTPTTGG